MQMVHTMEELEHTIHHHTMALVYISRPNCSVCHALLPQVELLLESYPEVKAVHADADEIPEVAGAFSIFTVPVIMVFLEGKEMFREARFVPMESLERQLSKIYNAIL
ncbi:thioredoxin family protein [Thalassobacillus hwangdonensis]|uniref:Thioredoxin family protein n=1 Tax=Thalassobacillus hwangdonensis TaxID=546108 RepID=A0ABW3L5Q3_9BACI